jgi:hypothetical protein
MSSLDPIPTTLRDQLRQLGLVHTAAELDDFVARATQKRWSRSCSSNGWSRRDSPRACVSASNGG